MRRRVALEVFFLLGSGIVPSWDFRDNVALASPGPTVRLDRLDLPAEASRYERFLRKTLEKEARHLDWGAGSGSVVEYRFVLQSLEIVVKDDVLNVRCTAMGRLPHGRSAKSQLNFGGEPKQREKLVERVLGIVAHGVLTRLAELERERRLEDDAS
ncbi:MAG TPA: hypothetical protein VHM70_26050 [Polyangiaceae bacterium]|jgi:hypothetical protein|nr:hypothetical protein [Polyangiaceae bacterium]